MTTTQTIDKPTKSPTRMRRHSQNYDAVDTALSSLIDSCESLASTIEESGGVLDEIDDESSFVKHIIEAGRATSARR